jgi:ubiquinol-cytochrome c reductase iron-sulfur subunit
MSSFLAGIRIAELFSFPPTNTALRALPKAARFAFPAQKNTEHDHDHDHEHGSHSHSHNKPPLVTNRDLNGTPMTASLFQLPLVRFVPKRWKSTFQITNTPDKTLNVPEAMVKSEARRDNATNGAASVSVDSTSGQAFTYLMVGGVGVTGAMAAKSTVMNFLSSLSASGDVLALAQVEMDLSSIPEGKSIVIKWRGKPIFIRHRTPAEIEDARAVDVSHLRDPQADEDRVQKPEWLVMIGICTHLGCVPIADAGDYSGWYCPCQ